MAQTKTRNSSSRSRSGKTTKPRSRSSGSSRATKSTGASGARKSANGSSRASGSGNGGGRLETARQTVMTTTRDTGRNVGQAAKKARVPLLASGAALAGMAGGVALGSRRKHRRAIAMPRMSSKDMTAAAKQVGRVGMQMGQIASEMERARERTADRGRSPVEVVLDGLTARRR